MIYLLVAVLFIGFIRLNIKLALIVSIMILVTSTLRFIPIDDFIYHTLLTVNYLIFFRLTHSPFLKTSLYILIFHSLASFSFDIADLILYSDLTWDLINYWASLYEYVYYSTIALIFAGLAGVGGGGLRDNSTRNDVFFANRNSANIGRV